MTDCFALAEEIRKKFGCIVKNRSKYINIYKEQRVYAQLHYRDTGDGLDLALCECGEVSDLPVCKILKRIDIRELKGYWKANKNWLEGDGRFTKHSAAAFNIPSILGNNPEHPGWKELEQLLKYAYGKKHYPGIDFLVGDMANIPLNDNSVDVVVCLEGFEHIMLLLCNSSNLQYISTYIE